MSVDVSIRVPGASMNIDRQTAHFFMDSDAKMFRDAANVLREIADDIDRMYPLDADPIAQDAMVAEIARLRDQLADPDFERAYGDAWKYCEHLDLRDTNPGRECVACGVVIDTTPDLYDRRGMCLNCGNKADDHAWAQACIDDLAKESARKQKRANERAECQHERTYEVESKFLGPATLCLYCHIEVGER